MEALKERERELQSELEDVVKREEVLIAVYQTLTGSDADDIEGDLRELRGDRERITHDLQVVRSRIKELQRV